MEATTPPCLEGSNAKRVIEFATREFFTRGVKSVKMDDIAKGLQMSKRTLYQLFADKEQLIIACINALLEEEHCIIKKMLEEEHNVLEIVLKTIEYRIKLIDKVSPQYIIDIARYDAVKKHLYESREDAINRAAEFLQLGAAQGYFRNDVCFRLLLQCLFMRIDSSTSLALLDKHDIHECFINCGIFHLRGCCTPKGIELIDTFLERYRKEHTKRPS